jgi:hypothetical protein
VIDWRVVAAAGVPVWAAVIGFVAWDKTRPRPAAPAAVAALPALVLPAPVAPPPSEPAKQPPPPVVVVPVVMHQPAAPAPRRKVPFWLREEADEPRAEDAGEQVEAPADGCRTFDTAVRFVKSPTEAMGRARDEDKLVYVLHLSGNLEDEGFT